MKSYIDNLRAELKQSGTTYPRVTNLSGKIQKKVNSVIKKTAYQAIPDYDPGMPVIEANSSYKTTLNKNGILSLRFEDYFYPEMAAHGVTGVSSVTVNLYTGHIYCFNELFRVGTDYRSELTKLIQAEIITRQIPMLKPFTGIEDEADFYLTPDSLVIYYQPYVYTPGYYGVLEFVIPYNQIINIIDPQGPIKKVLSGI